MILLVVQVGEVQQAACAPGDAADRYQTGLKGGIHAAGTNQAANTRWPVRGSGGVMVRVGDLFGLSWIDWQPELLYTHRGHLSLSDGRIDTSFNFHYLDLSLLNLRVHPPMRWTVEPYVLLGARASYLLAADSDDLDNASNDRTRTDQKSLANAVDLAWHVAVGIEVPLVSGAVLGLEARFDESVRRLDAAGKNSTEHRGFSLLVSYHWSVASVRRHLDSAATVDGESNEFDH